mmetsp:Transcript_9892/g.29089  ORF Transcript_9892/g.29089 Transcript_9892/m.29089 type:complete len:222 (-) Transcript_9892:241-906(-)
MSMWPVLSESTVGMPMAMASMATRFVPPSQRFRKMAASIVARTSGISSCFFSASTRILSRLTPLLSTQSSMSSTVTPSGAPVVCGLQRIVRASSHHWFTHATQSTALLRGFRSRNFLKATSTRSWPLRNSSFPPEKMRSSVLGCCCARTRCRSRMPGWNRSESTPCRNRPSLLSGTPASTKTSLFHVEPTSTLSKSCTLAMSLEVTLEYSKKMTPMFTAPQ